MKAVKDVNITCFKCHGAGSYRVPILDDNGEWTDDYESCKCEICKGDGKITLDFYEWLQKQMRAR